MKVGVISSQKTAKKAIKHAKAIITSAILPKSGSFSMFKKQFEVAYKNMELKKTITQKDIDSFLNIFNSFQEGDNSTALNVAYELLRRGFDLWHKSEYNPINNLLYEKIADEDTPDDIKEIVKNVISRKNISKELGILITEAYMSLENENVKKAFESNSAKDIFYKRIEDKIKNIKNLKKQKEMQYILEKNKNFIDDLFFGKFESYDKYISKYVNLSNLYYENDILSATISTELFKNSEDKTLYKNKADNLREFMQSYFESEKIQSNLFQSDEKFYENLFSVKEQVESFTKEEVESLNEAIEAIESINKNENYIYTKDGEKKLALKAIKENLNLSEDLFKLKTAVKEKIKAEDIEIEELNPHELEALKQSALDKYYQRTLIGLYELDNINPIVKMTGKLFKTKTDFFNEDGTINQERYVLNTLINQPKAKLLKCLANAMNPKNTHETGAGLSSQCVKEYIQEIERKLNQLDKIMDEPGLKEVLGFTGIIFFVHFLRLHFYRQKKIGESNSVILEKNYYEVKEMISKLKNPLEIKQAEKYLELISKENKSKLLIGSTRKELNAVVSLAIKDLTNYYVNHKDVKEFLEIKKNMILNNLTKKLSTLDLYKSDIYLKKISSLKEDNETYEKLKKELLKILGNDEFSFKVYEKLIERNILTVNEENLLRALNEVIEDTNSEVFKDKIFGMLNLSEEYIRLSRLLENKEAIEERMKVTENEKNKLLEKLQQLKEKGSEKEILALKNQLANVVKEQTELQEFYRNTQINIFKAQYGEKADNWIEINEIIKSLKDDKEKMNQLLEILKTEKDIEYSKIINDIKSKEKSILFKQKRLEKLTNNPTKMEEKIKKINKFLEQGKLILDQKELNNYVNFIEKEIMEDAEKHMDEIKKAREQQMPEAEKLLKNILKEKIAMELLFEQEQKLKRLTIEMLKKNNIDLAQYYGTLYNQTLEVIESSRERIKSLKEEIDKHLVEISGDRVIIEFNRTSEDVKEQNKIMFEIPNSEYKYLEKMNNLLKSGNYFELINMPDKKDVEMLLKFLKNNYKRLTLHGQDIRKYPNIKVDWKLNEKVNHTNVELEILEKNSILNKLNEDMKYDAIDKITDLKLNIGDKIKNAFSHLKDVFTPEEKIDAVMYNVDKWEKEQKEKEELREYLKELEGEQIDRKTRLHKRR